MSLVNASPIRAARASSSSSSDDDSTAVFSSSMSVRSRSSTIATTRSQVGAFQDEEQSYYQRLEFEQPERENYCTLAPSQTIITASPRTDHDDSYQRGEGDGLSTEVEHQYRDARSAPPPVPEVRIPLSAVVRQGLVELSREDWKSLYLTTSKNLEVARMHVYHTSQENRQLKRRLIEMQKSLFESRRNRSQHLPTVPDHMYPWSIPDSRRSTGTSTSTRVTTTAATTRVTPSAPLVVTSTASEEDSSNDDGFAPPKNPIEAALLSRPSKVQRRGSSLTASSTSTSSSSAACSETS